MVNPTSLISVCICTYKRPQLLDDLLMSLAIQEHSNFDYELVIADNDREGSARDVVEHFSARHPDLIVQYAIEPQQGISFARNRTVAMAGGAYMAFIDDDETASPNWLDDLYVCLTATGADAVFGPVLPVFPPGSKKWAIKSGLFDRPRYMDRAVVGSGDGRTGNALVRSHWCRQRTPHCFRENLARSGGEDHDFFNWLESSGGVLLWSDMAVVSEVVPLVRQSVGLILERSFRASVSYWRTVNATRTLSLVLIEAVIGATGGLVFMVVGGLALTTGLASAIRWWVKAMKGFGRVAALTGIQLIGYGAAK